MKTIANFVTKHPVIAIIISIGFVILCAAGMPRVEIDPDIENMLPDDPEKVPSVTVTDKIEEVFGSDEMVMVMLSIGDDMQDIYDVNFLLEAEKINNSLCDAPYIISTMSIFEYKNAYMDRNNIDTSDLVDFSDLNLRVIDDIGREELKALYVSEFQDADTDAIENMSLDELKDLYLREKAKPILDELRESVKSNPTVYGMIVSEDEKSLLIGARLKSEVKLQAWLDYIGIEEKVDETAMHLVLDDDIMDKYPPVPPELNGDKDYETKENPASLIEIEEKYNGSVKTRYSADVNMKTTVAGAAYLRYWNAKKIAGDVQKFLGIGIIIMLVFLFACFRTIRGVILPFGVVLMSIACTLGMIGWTGQKVYLVSILIFPFLIAVTNDYGIHLVARYYEDVKDYFKTTDKKGIAAIGLRKMMFPISLACITTMIGMLALLSHTLRPAAMLGAYTAFGVLVALMLTIFFIPAVLALINIPKKLQEESYNKNINRVLKSIAEFVYRHYKKVLVSAIAILIIFGAFIPFIIVDSDVFNFYPEDSEVLQAFDKINDNFGGAINLNLFISSDKKDVLKDLEVLKQLEDLKIFIENLRLPDTGEPAVGKVNGVTDIIAHLHKVRFSDYVEEEVIPDYEDFEKINLDEMSDFINYGRYTKIVEYLQYGINVVSSEEANEILGSSDIHAAIINKLIEKNLISEEYANLDRTQFDTFLELLLNYELIDEQLFHGIKDITDTNNFISSKINTYFSTYRDTITIQDMFLDKYSDDYNQTQIVIRTQGASHSRLSYIVDSINNYVKENPIKDVSVQLGGFAMNLYYLPTFIVKSQILSLVYSLIIVCIIVMIVLRSFWGGIITTVPIIISIVVAFGMMAIVGIELNFFTAMLTSVLIGIGVDYSIHLVWRFKEEFSKTQDFKSAYINTLTTVGKGIIFNALSVVVGFAAALFSAFLPVFFFGFLIGISILMSLIGAFTIVPALFFLFKPKFLSKNMEASNEI